MKTTVVIEWVVTERHRLEMTGDDFGAAFNIDPATLLADAVPGATDAPVARAAIGEDIDKMADAEDGDTWQATEERELIHVSVKTVE